MDLFLFVFFFPQFSFRALLKDQTTCLILVIPLFDFKLLSLNVVRLNYIVCLIYSNIFHYS